MNSCAFGFFVYLAGHAVHVTAVQRYVSMPSIREARRSLVVNGVMSFFAMYPPIFRERKRLALNVTSLEELVWLLKRGGTFAGLHPDSTWVEVGIDSIEELGLGLVIAAVTLWLLGRVTFDMTVTEAMWKSARIGTPVTLNGTTEGEWLWTTDITSGRAR